MDELGGDVHRPAETEETSGTWLMTLTEPITVARKQRALN